jgi:hypothetical protein
MNLQVAYKKYGPLLSGSIREGGNEDAPTVFTQLSREMYYDRSVMSRPSFMSKSTLAQKLSSMNEWI